MRTNSIKKNMAIVASIIMAVSFVFGSFISETYALTSGIYVGTAVPHYRHPETNEIEDSGGEKSEVLGQSMTESATYNRALVEVDNKGDVYVTVRLKLMDNIESPKFQADGKDVESALMQEDYENNTADFRMKVKDENAVLRCSMYVVPMGRDVVFYITVQDLIEGSEDFVVTSETDPSVSSDNNNTAIYIICAVVGVCIILFVVWFFAVYKKKK